MTRASKARRPRVVVVAKRSVWRRWVDEERDPRVREMLDRHDPTVRRLRGAHEDHEATVAEVRAALDELGIDAKWVRRAHGSFDASGADLVITVGGDGTLLAASHHVGATPVLGVNSAPSHSVGFFCGARKGGVRRQIAAALAGRLPRVTLHRMEVERDGEVLSRRVLNDALFCHASPAATSSYIVKLGRAAEEHKSSGLWVGPAAGSTAAQFSAGGRMLPLGSRRLQLVVREPYAPAGRRLRLTHALVADGDELRIASKMRDARLFLDGPHEVVSVGLGEVITFRRSGEPLHVLALPRARHRRA